MSEADSAVELREQGVVLLRGVFAKNPLIQLQQAAARCFEMAEAESSLPEQYHFNRFSHSVLLNALEDFGCSSEELVTPISAPGFASLFLEAMGCTWSCRMEQSWVRKKFAPLQAPVREYHPQVWNSSADVRQVCCISQNSITWRCAGGSRPGNSGRRS
jgi:hypothetical protein